MTKPLVSIIIPVYKKQEYMEKCLKSVCGQTYQKIEILCILDGPFTDSEEILVKYAKEDKRIKIQKHAVNLGLSVARNAGIKQAKGEYVFFVDDDDFLEPEAVEKLTDYAENSQADAVYFNAWCIQDKAESEKELIFSNELANEKEIISGKMFFSRMLEKHYFRGAVWAQFWKRETFLKKCLYFEPGFCHEDALFTFQALLADTKILCVDYVGYNYRIRPGSIMTSFDPVKRKVSLLKILKIVLEKEKEFRDSKVMEEAFLNYLDTLIVMVDPEFTDLDEICRIEKELGADYDLRILYRFLSGHSGRFINWDTVEQSKLDDYDDIFILGMGRKEKEVLQMVGEKYLIKGFVKKEEQTGTVFYGLPLVTIDELARRKGKKIVLVPPTSDRMAATGELKKMKIDYLYLD